MEELNLDEDRIYAVLEPLRKKQKMWMVMSILPFVLSFALSIMLSMIDNPDVVTFAAFAPFIGFGGTFAVGWKAAGIRGEYISVYKGMVSKQVLKACFKDAKYEPEKGISRQEFEETKLVKINSQHEYKSEDLISGRYAGVEFRQSDVEIYHYEKSGKNRRQVIDVNGRVCSFSFEKDIVGDILIVKDFSKTIRPQDGMEKVEMEDVDFNKKFDVYAYDAHSVFYLLTPHFMEYIKQIHGKDSSIYISFDGKNLHILRSGSGGIFEPPNSKKFDVKAEVRKSYRQLHEIVELIDVFNLDERVNQDKMIKEEPLKETQKEEVMPEENEWNQKQTETTESKFGFKLKM